MANNTLLASDNFASGSLAAGWSAGFGFSVPQIASGPPKVAEANVTGGTPAGVIWTGTSFPNDHACEITSNALTNEVNSAFYLFTRWRSSSGSGSGYYTFINGTSMGIFRDDSGTGTQLGASATGLTFAAGDIFTFQAAGSCLSVYQNGKRIMYRTDTTYTGGSVGFLISAGTAVTHAQVASWRGYSAIQQDGIWQKKGVVLAPNSTEMAAASAVGLYEGCCIFDSNPQILAGPNVYKLWYSAGNTTASASSYYAESPDLVNWTRYTSNPVITGFTTPQVIKVGSTYHLYCQGQAAQGSGNIAHYTSSDGVTWAQQSTNVLSLGAGGTWDSITIYPLKPIAVINGTLYALYGGASVSGGIKTGLVTSPDGATWTKYAGNPLLPSGSSPLSVYPYPCFSKVGSTYYVWMQKGPSASQGSSVLDPPECLRYSTTDFINWSAPVASLHHSQLNESLNLPNANGQAVGGVGPIAIFDVGGKANILYGGSQGDAVGPVISQYQLAVGPAPIASVITANEDAVAQTTSDAFTSGTGNLSGNWSAISGLGLLKIVAGNKAEPATTGNATCAALYTAISFPSSQYSEVTIATLSSSGFVGPVVLGHTVSISCYYASITATAGTQTYIADIRANNGSGTDVSLIGVAVNGVGITVQVGDVLRLSVVQLSGVGNVLSLFQNGSLIAQGVDVASVGPLSGSPGVFLKEASAGQTQISSWAGGNANVIPSYTTAVGWSPVDSRQAVKGFGPAANTGIVDAQGNTIYSAQDPPFTGNSQVSDNTAIPPTDSRKAGAPVDSRAKVPVNSRVAPPFKS